MNVSKAINSGVQIPSSSAIMAFLNRDAVYYKYLPFFERCFSPIDVLSNALVFVSNLPQDSISSRSNIHVDGSTSLAITLFGVSPYDAISPNQPKSKWLVYRRGFSNFSSDNKRFLLEKDYETY